MTVPEPRAGQGRPENRRWTIQVLRRTPTVAGAAGSVRLSPTPGRLLCVLVAGHGAPVTKAQVKRALWGTSDVPDDQVKRVASALRAGLRTLGSDLIATDRGVGYRLADPNASVDLFRLEHHIARAEAHLSGGDVLTAVATARKAERQWVGYPAVDLPMARERIRRAFAIQILPSLALDSSAAASRVFERARATLRPDDFDRLRDEVLTQNLIRAAELLDAGGTGEVVRARDLMERTLTAYPESAEAMSLRSYADWRMYYTGFEQSRSLTALERDARRVLYLRPDCVSARLTMTHILFERGLGDEELDQARAAIRSNPGSRRSWLTLARAYVDTGHSASAIPLLEDALADNPRDPRALDLLTFANLHRGRYADAISAGTRYIEARSLDGNISWGMALAHIHRREYGPAADLLKRALALEPHNVALWVQLVNAYALDRGDASARQVALAGLTALDRYIDLSSTANFRTVAWYAELLAQAGRRDQVGRTARLVRTEAPCNGYVAYRLALAVARLGRLDESLALLDDAVRFGFRSVEQMRQEVVCIPPLARSPDVGAFLDRMEDLVGAGAAERAQ